MKQVFFPDPVFAWVFFLVLFLLTCVAAWTDTRRAKIPNRLTVAILILGIVMSAVRGGWMASNNQDVWLLNTGEAWVGAIDGVLFAVAGFIVYFALMFVMWIMNACGGGDVKLLSSVAAWLGIKIFSLLWMASIIFLVVWMLARVVAGDKVIRRVARPTETTKDGKKKQPLSAARQIRATYSLPFAVATAVVLLWLFRFDLQLVPRPQPQQPAQAPGTSAHVRSLPNYA